MAGGVGGSSGSGNIFIRIRHRSLALFSDSERNFVPYICMYELYFQDSYCMKAVTGQAKDCQDRTARTVERCNTGPGG